MNWIIQVERCGVRSYNIGSEGEIRRVAAVYARDQSARIVDGPRAMTNRETRSGARRNAAFGLYSLVVYGGAL